LPKKAINLENLKYEERFSRKIHFAYPKFIHYFRVT